MRQHKLLAFKRPSVFICRSKATEPHMPCWGANGLQNLFLYINQLKR